MAYPISDPTVFPIVPTTTTIQKFQGVPDNRSTCVGSETRNPAYGRISSRPCSSEPQL